MRIRRKLKPKYELSVKLVIGLLLLFASTTHNAIFANFAWGKFMIFIGLWCAICMVTLSVIHKIFISIENRMLQIKPGDPDSHPGDI